MRHWIFIFVISVVQMVHEKHRLRFAQEVSSRGTSRFRVRRGFFKIDSENILEMKCLIKILLLLDSK